MKTRDALRALTKGENKSEGLQGPLAERTAEFLARWEDREKGIIARKNQDLLNTPVLEVLRKKIAKVAGEAERTTPVTMRFYAYTAVKAAADADPRDRGIAQAAHVLEHLWRKEPMGSLTLGQVMDLRAHLKDSFPKSKVAKTLDSAISRVGYSTLPVAKLARLAQQIETQDDFDHLIRAAGYDGNRPEQVKARTLVRELIAMRGFTLAAEAAVDERSTLERVTDRVAKEAQLVKDEPALHPNIPGDSMGMDELAPGDENLLPGPGMPDAGPALETPAAEEEAVDSVVPMIEEVNEIVEDTMPPEAEPFVEQELAEGQGTPGTAEWGFQEAEEGHTEAPPSETWQHEELAEHGLGGGEPPMGDLPVGGDEGLHGEMPIGEPVEEPGMGGVLEHGMSGKLAQKRASIQAAMGTRTAQHDIGNPPFKSAPGPGAQADLDTETQRLERAYKAGLMNARDYLTARRDLELRARDLTPGLPDSQPLTLPKVAEGLDAPKPAADGQIERHNNDAPDRSKDGGKELTKNETKSAFALTAAEIEAALVDRGEEVRYGTACLRINDSDEVEFWHRGAGQACGLMDMDLAIQDFIKATASEHKDAQPKGFYQRIQLVPVPCGRCAKVDSFEFSTDPGDLYACGECGHRTKASLIASMVKHGQLGKQFAITVEVPSHITFDPQVKRMFEQKLASAVHGTHNGNLYQRSPTEWEIVVSDESSVQKLQQVLAQLGIEESQTVRRAQFDPGAVAAPGSADQALPADVQPQGAQAPKPAPQQGPADATPAPGAAVPGAISNEDIAAAFRHYKAMELPFPEAMAQFAKDYKEKIEAGWQSPTMDVALIDIARQLYSSTGPSPTMGQVMAARAAFKLAFKNPAVNQQQPDAVSAPSMKDKNSDEKDTGRMHAPKPKANGKQPGAGSQPGTKAPPKDMGKTNEDKHPSGLDAPKPPADGHVKGKAGDQPGTAPVSSKELGNDSDHNGKEIPLPGKFGPRPKVGSKAASKSRPSSSKPSKSK